MASYFESTEGCEVDFLNRQPLLRSICNFDICKLQTVPSIKTPEILLAHLIPTCADYAAANNLQIEADWKKPL